MRRVWIGGIGLMVLALALPMCTGVPMTAPSNSDISLFANPRFVPANGGVSVVTAIVTEPAGTPPPNGTVVFFFTELGRVDAQGKTKDGVARVNFVSDSRSGTARVTAVSGGVAAPPTTPPAPTTTTLPPVAQGRLISRLFDMAVAHADKNTDFVDIIVGITNAASIIVVASPAVITSPGSALVTASVSDENGNPLANVPVVFSVEASPTLYETLDSGGTPQFTDTNGQAFDRVRTRSPIGIVQRKVTIRATIPTGSGTGTLVVIGS